MNYPTEPKPYTGQSDPNSELNTLRKREGKGDPYPQNAPNRKQIPQLRIRFYH